MYAYRTLALALPALVALGCGDAPKRRLGETCSTDGQCDSGLCVEERCLDPEADDDGDGLLNRVEAALGTSPLKRDSDDDGVDDPTEVGADQAAPRDFDGDHRIDALESATADADQDCIADQRDGDDAKAETDAAEVADLACCCEGRCSEHGVTATATCTGGDIVCDPAEPDRDGDGVADACDVPALALSQAEVEAGCTTACQTIGGNCEGALPSCVSDCVARATHEGLWLANYVCFAVSSCDEARCFPPGGFAEEPDCRDACANAVACGIDKAFDQTLTEPACRAQCAGEYRGGGESVAGLACLANLEPKDDCRLVDALPCVANAQMCNRACERLAPLVEGGAQHEVCAAEAPVFGRYATAQACTDACGALGGFGEVAFLGCMISKGCSDPGTVCATDVTTPAAGCDAACAALASHCSGAGILGEASVCQALCTGVTDAAPWLAPADASACIGSAVECPSEDVAVQVLLSCLFQSAPEPRCTTTCDRIEACASELQIPAPELCDAHCSSLVLSHPERIDPTLACIHADTSCLEVPGCIPPGPEDVCDRACQHRVKCDPNYLGGLDGCNADCEADVGQDLARYADWMCESLAQSCDTVCGDLATTAPDAACVAACTGSDACIEAAYGLCPRACQGALRAYGETTSPSCVVGALGRRCNNVAVVSCDPG